MVSGLHFLRYGFGPAPSPAPSNDEPDVYPSSAISLGASDEDTSLPHISYDDLDVAGQSDSNADDSFQAALSPYTYQPLNASIWKPFGTCKDLPWSPDTNMWDSFLHFVPPTLASLQWPIPPPLVMPQPQHEVALQDALERFQEVLHPFNERKETWLREVEL